ncbi:MAG: maleylpyruvate isomerase N-terminal domain-containing protein [Spirochaetia bacterium]|nr:maleylpyruvate isomerase N-terminal domain-containing protein [Spirochaetia bacterium]
MSETNLSNIPDTRKLFRELSGDLAHFLRTLRLADWNRKTISAKWTVRDIAAHLLDGSMRRVSVHRDNFAMPPYDTERFPVLFNYLDHLNSTWVEAARRLSPQVLLEMIERFDSQYASLMDAADLEGQAVFPVDWMGEATSTNRADFARDYTEKWYHQQQIRHAFDSHAIESPRYLRPVYDIFALAVPVALAELNSTSGDTATLIISGQSGGTWSFVYDGKAWKSTSEVSANSIELEARYAWRFLTNRAYKAEKRASVEKRGKPDICEALLNTLAMMA